jgi:GntR family transcriptional regulator
MSSDDLAMYKQVKLSLLEKIGSGEYRVGDQMPTEFELCRMFNVSRSTVRQAMQDLVTDGVISKKQGKGTFVASINRSFSSLVISNTPAGADRSFRFLSAEEGLCDEARAAVSGYKVGDRLLKMNRLRLENSVPVALKWYFVPGRFFDNQPLTEEEAEHEVIDRILEKRHVEVRRVHLSILPATPSPAERELLEISPDTLCLKVTEEGFSSNDTVRLTQTLIRCDKAGYFMSITMAGGSKRTVSRSYIGIN